MTTPTRRRGATGWRSGLTALAAASAIFGAGWALNGAMTPVAATEPTSAVAEALQAPDGHRTSYADLVEQVAPAVVTIRAERLVHTTGQEFRFGDDPFFRRFFGDRLPEMPRDFRQGGLGSGVIVDAAGYVLTNNHVVEGAEEVSVELSDRRRLEAKIVGTDPPSDLAVLKIEAENLPNLPLGDSDAARVGDVVLAFGNPLGVGQTVTMGILSAKGRATGANSDGYEDFLQTDAPINRGNSGGPLVNLRGEIVGINTQIVSPSGGNIGIGFSIPANMARHVMDQLVEHGAVRRGLLGVTVQGVSADLARSLGLEDVQGALVSSVQPGSAGDRAGIERGDVITRLNNEPVRDSNSLRNAIAGTDPGTSVKLTIVRDGASRELTATLDELQPTARRGGRSSGAGPAESRYGLSVRPVTPELAGRFDLDAASGLLVTDVDPAGVAARAGLREGDVILEVDRRAVSTADELRSALDASGDTPALVLVLREGATIFLAVPQPAER